MFARLTYFVAVEILTVVKYKPLPLFYAYDIYFVCFYPLVIIYDKKVNKIAKKNSRKEHLESSGGCEELWALSKTALVFMVIVVEVDEFFIHTNIDMYIVLKTYIFL